MEYENIIYSVEDGIATLRLNRPKALNALNAAINHEIMAAIRDLAEDPSVRVLILTGNAQAFAAGADVKEMAEATPRFAREFCGLAIDINNTLEALPIPVIAAVGGFALGGGCEMTLACDFRVGSSRTVLSFPEVGLGIIPGANGCARATALLGPAKAKQLVMLTEMIHGKQAYDLGLLNWFVTSPEAEELNAAASDARKQLKAARQTGNEQEIRDAKSALKEADARAAEAEYELILAKANEVARMLIEKPSCALAAAKSAINQAAKETVVSGMARETTEFTLLFDTHDQKEGMAAMIEKRPAQFTNS